MSTSARCMPRPYRPVNAPGSPGFAAGTNGRTWPSAAAQDNGFTIVRTVRRGQVPGHLLLGVNAADMTVDHARRRLSEATTWEQVSRSAGFAEACPVPLPGEDSDLG
ncbi:hypothetical protein [Streptomyces sp. GESEQ-35]|uniref:hypothetical protein n=1 Tax=Streptomyces sp. GESEQ-35 TaxID=2812657 RepID=UPI001FF18BD4|nr:hypothetical protein [Streptomyces sp. GESEQ-35]